MFLCTASCTIVVTCEIFCGLMTYVGLEKRYSRFELATARSYSRSPGTYTGMSNAWSCETRSGSRGRLGADVALLTLSSLALADLERLWTPAPVLAPGLSACRGGTAEGLARSLVLVLLDFFGPDVPGGVGSTPLDCSGVFGGIVMGIVSTQRWANSLCEAASRDQACLGA